MIIGNEPIVLSMNYEHSTSDLKQTLKQKKVLKRLFYFFFFKSISIQIYFSSVLKWISAASNASLVLLTIHLLFKNSGAIMYSSDACFMFLNGASSTKLVGGAFLF